ncbi:Glutamate racemase [Beijerinckiaceae bacterium RH AL1]|nr:glutamate racemase [Beijerinckiaceae bacterium]VVB43523.1 Glutamate racemase [Beijerinckiaceae bacterium RH AL8]VVB43540.1 Glutamate racemase [Beijerinckiaceae bacterium RH CH11]VVC53884.1 Glutamate racemase [Beijerinckiaceae bacterium RH AL1]
MAAPANILVFDSGLGGLTVASEVARLRPDARITYAADDAGFPYGDWSAAELGPRVVALMRKLVDDIRPDLCVVACNTASTLVLADLREALPNLPFVGTVPAIKPAAALSRSRLVSVLATPGTVQREYTRALIDSFAAGCAVTLVGSTKLAAIAEAAMAGAPVADEAIAAEIAPCFVQDGDGERRTDVVVLACTHYPLLVDRFTALAPWPVTWLDPAPAIARRTDSVLAETGFEKGAPEPQPIPVHFTSGKRLSPAIARAFAARGLTLV